MPTQIWCDILSCLPCLLLCSYLIRSIFKYDAISCPRCLAYFDPIVPDSDRTVPAPRDSPYIYIYIYSWRVLKSPFNNISISSQLILQIDCHNLKSTANNLISTAINLKSTAEISNRLPISIYIYIHIINFPQRFQDTSEQLLGLQKIARRNTSYCCYFKLLICLNFVQDPGTHGHIS